MTAIDHSAASDAAELQNVLTRYVDSCEGYEHMAEVIDVPHLSEAFREIAAQRREMVDRVSSLILVQGEKPDPSSSPEAAIHRWWISIRAGMTDEDLNVTLSECVRGEKELIRTILAAVEKGDLSLSHKEIIADMAVEVKEAITIFQTALNH